MQSTHHRSDQPWPDLGGTPAAVLRHAAQYLVRHGWTSLGFYDWTDPTLHFPPACVAGAIRCAVFGHPVDTLYLEIVDPHHDRNAALTTAAQAALADEVDPDWHSTDDGCVGGLSCALEVISHWNDHNDRTLPEILAALYSAADAWDHAHPRPDVAVTS